MRQSTNIGFIQLHEGASAQAVRQYHGAITDANQATDGMTDRLHHASHFTITTFRNGDAVPTVGAFATAVFDGAKLSHAVFEHDAIEQFLLFFVAQSAQHAHCIFTL